MKKSPTEGGFEIRINRDFEATMRGCMASRDDGTWINDELVAAYRALHELGFAHSVECWRDGELAGGLYGVSLGAAFFGESMFHRQRDASKVALVHLVDRLARAQLRAARHAGDNAAPAALRLRRHPRHRITWHGSQIAIRQQSGMFD